MPFYSSIDFRFSICRLRSTMVLSRSAMQWSRSVIAFSLSKHCSLRAWISRSLSASNLCRSLIWSKNWALWCSSISYAFYCSYSLANLTVSLSFVYHSLIKFFLSMSACFCKASSDASFSINRSLYFLLCSWTWAAISLAWAFLSASTASLLA